MIAEARVRDCLAKGCRLMSTSAVNVLPTAFQGRGRIGAEAALR